MISKQFARIVFITALAFSTRPIVFAQSPSSPGGSWTGTWATSPIGADAHRSFDHQTIRQVVHTSIGGTTVRLQFSNAFGTQPVKVESLHIARSAGGASIVPSSDQQVRFAGQPFRVIPPGSIAVSDPLSFSVPPLSDIAITMYLVEATGAPTFHKYAHQTSYIASGNGTQNETLVGVEKTTSSYFLTNLDVLSQPPSGALVTLGASITEGFISTDDTNHRWPDLLAKRLQAAGMRIGILNEGIAGNRLLGDGSGPSAKHRFESDAINQPGVRWISVSDDPINDLSRRPLPSANDLTDGVRQLISVAHQHQIRFLCSTLTPFEGASYWTPEGEVVREQVNAFLRSKDSGCDALVDEDTATHDPSHPSRYLPAYDAGDHLHPNEAGLQAIANAFDLNVFRE